MNKKNFFREPANAITHLLGILFAFLGGVPLLIDAYNTDDVLYFVGMTIYLISMILLYTASTLYHSLCISDKVTRRLKKLDHMMICVLIAGTYTPICLISLRGVVGYALLGIIWGFALVGILFKAFWVTCPKWVSSVLYVCMGWTCVLAFTKLWAALSTAAFWWLLAGGIIYTIGAIIYAMKLSLFNLKHESFGSHAIFHLFVLGGSVCHYIVMWLL